MSPLVTIRVAQLPDPNAGLALVKDHLYHMAIISLGSEKAPKYRLYYHLNNLPPDWGLSLKGWTELQSNDPLVGVAEVGCGVLDVVEFFSSRRYLVVLSELGSKK